MTATLTVYEHPLSPYAQKVKLALREKQVDFEVAMPAFGTAEAAEFARLNPRAEVPVLVHGDNVIFESSVILDYIEDCWPAPALLPDSAPERAAVRVLENLMDTHFEANTWGLGEIAVFGRASGEQAARIMAFGEREIRTWHDWLDKRLGNSEWFNGAEFGYGDICVVPYVTGAGRFDIWPATGSRLASWLERVSERASVALTQREAQAAELDPATMQAALAAGFKREYRDHRLEWMVRAGGLAVVADGIAAGNIRFVEAGAF